MRLAYLDCATGISGDMTVAALLDAGIELAALRAGVDSLRLPGVQLHVTETMRGDFRALHFRVDHPEQHAHRHMADIEAILRQADELSVRQRHLARSMFRAIATAEARVHGTTPDKIHFHEVGAIDSIVDVVAASIGFDLLGVDEVVCSPLPTGRGDVRIAHGRCRVPTPGTVELLRGIPLVDEPIEAELTTPTGAAIVRTLVDRFSLGVPEMTIESVGCGAGTRDFPERANILRILVGTAVEDPQSDTVVLLESNLDDVSGEVLGYARQRLQQAGALDCYTIPIQMKKDRPGVVVCVLAKPADAPRLEEILFAETGTLGIRRQILRRSILARTTQTVETPYGTVVGKVSGGGGKRRFAPEFEACAKLAADRQVPLRDVYRAAETAFSMLPATGGEPATTVPSHGHSHDHSHDHGHDRSHDHDHGHRHDRDHSHNHDHGHRHDHDHGHRHDHDHGKGPATGNE